VSILPSEAKALARAMLSLGKHDWLNWLYDKDDTLRQKQYLDYGIWSLSHDLIP